jgi:hypothetical protein
MLSPTVLRWVVALCLASSFSACGGEDRLSAEEYRAELATLTESQVQVHAEVEKAFSARTVDEVQERLAEFGDGQRRLGDGVEQLNPPEDAEDVNAAMARAAHEFADEIGVVVARLSRFEDPDATKAALALMDRSLERSKGARELDAALFELRRLGYTPSD